jgi:hypothetical protein
MKGVRRLSNKYDDLLCFGSGTTVAITDVLGFFLPYFCSSCMKEPDQMYLETRNSRGGLMERIMMMETTMVSTH